MMSQGSKRELVAAIRPRNLKANKAGKEQILNEFIATTGYHRKSANPNAQTCAQTKRIDKSWSAENLQGRSGPGLGADLGNLWADLFQATATVTARDHSNLGTPSRTLSYPAYQGAFIEHEPFDH